MSRKTILFIGGSLNQTRMGHKIAQQLQGEYDCAFTPYYTGLALGKEVHSYFDVATLRRLAPIQNGGTSAGHIADVCRSLLEGEPVYLKQGATYATAD